MRWLICLALTTGLIADLAAHQPDRENQRIWPRIDLIPPLGVNLAPSYARTHNRPSRRIGWLAYQIAPTSREAIAWHDASHQNAYEMDRGRLEKHFFYSKPWENLKTGPRPQTVVTPNVIQPITSDDLREAIRVDDRKLESLRP